MSRGGSFDKITKVCAGIYKGVATSQLDELAAETTVGKTANHPDYASLAARIAVSNLHKNTLKSFAETVKLSSCFLVCMKEDSTEGIYDTLKQCAVISKSAGGIGVSVHNIYSANDAIKFTVDTSTIKDQPKVKEADG
ncbi:ribonucleoside-diphosphate reductase [Medicago truncatula]|uniref:Ribonucleoside-diphosphate reductase n=1 Tax=Medicago truncatula TaxID=3880 RepID=G7LC82_MEDTR|nr:ribonucleoside-diphosphate reductase [Medicago truncatula]